MSSAWRLRRLSISDELDDFVDMVQCFFETKQNVLAVFRLFEVESRCGASRLPCDAS